MFMKQSSGDHLLTPEKVKEHIRRREEHFNQLSEEEQILARQLTGLHIGYGVYDPTGKPREETAREYLIKELGPKFAGRVLRDPRLRKLACIDEPPLPPSCADGSTD